MAGGPHVTRVLAVAAHPALDHALLVDAIEPGRVHRTARSSVTAGGKTVNAARAARALGAIVRIAGVSGGAAGRHLAALAAAEGLGATWVEAAGETRICTLLSSLSTGESTVVNEEGAPLTPEAWDALRELVAREAAGIDVLLLSGSLPPGAPQDAYRELVSLAGGSRVVLDARGPELLRALPARPTFVHMNAEELARTVSRSLAREDERRAALRELLAAGAGTVVLSDGPGPVLVEGALGSWKLDPPRVREVQTVGCGDALAGAIAALSPRGLPPREILSLAVAAASAAAETEVPALLDPARARELVAEVVARTI